MSRPQRPSGLDSIAPWLRTCGPLATVTAAALWVTRSFWWPGRYVVAFDGFTYTGPSLVTSADAYRDLRLPLWNDAIFSGVTHIGNPQAGVLYLPRLAVAVLDENRAMGVLVAAHVVVLGLGMLALARRLGLMPWAACFVGVAAVLNGSTLTKATQFEQILVLAWAPWLLVAILWAVTSSSSRRSIAALAVVTAAMMLAGHPQMVFESAMLAAAFTAGLAVTDSRWRRLPVIASGVALGVLVASPQLVATAVATSHSVIRSGRDDAVLGDPALSLVPGHGARALLGSLTARDPAVFAGSFEGLAFVGVVTAVLALVGFVVALGRRDRRPWTIALAAVAAIATVWSLGPRTPVFRLAATVVPGFDLARVSSRWLVVVVLVTCLSAGMGLEAIAGGLSRRQAAIAGGAVAGTAVVVAATGSHHVAAPDATWEWLPLSAIAVAAIVVAATSGHRVAHWTAVAVGVLAAVALAVMSLHSIPQHLATDVPFTSETLRTPTTDWLAGRPGYTIAFTDDLRPPSYGVPGLRPNANVLVDVRSVDGYDGGVQITDRWAAALRRINPAPAVDFPLRNNALAPLDPVEYARLGVRFVLIDRTRDAAELVPGWAGPQAVDDMFEVWENPAWRGEAIAYPAAATVDATDAPDVLRGAAAELSDTALVTGTGQAFVCEPGAATDCRASGLAVERSTPEHMIVTTDLAHRSIVALDQQFDDGWRVTVDGRAVDPVEVDGFVVGADVPAGRHTVDWRYRPPWLTPVLVISALAVVAVVSLLAIGRRSRPGGSREQLPDLGGEALDGEVTGPAHTG